MGHEGLKSKTNKIKDLKTMAKAKADIILLQGNLSSSDWLAAIE